MGIFDELLSGLMEAIAGPVLEKLFEFLFWLLSRPWQLVRWVYQLWSKNQNGAPLASQKEDKPAQLDPDFDDWPTS